MDENEAKSLKDKLHVQESRIYEFQERFTYYILAIDAACIGFSINLTKDNKLSWLLIGIAVSIILWGISFYFGIKELQLREKNHIAMYRHTDAVIQKAPTVKAQHFTEIGRYSNDTEKLRGKKMNFLYYGICVFVVWDVLNIISHSFNLGA